MNARYETSPCFRAFGFAFSFDDFLCHARKRAQSRASSIIRQQDAMESSDAR
jgi:hypothetical protein